MELKNYIDLTCKIMNASLTQNKLDLSNYENDATFINLMKEQTFISFLYTIDRKKTWKTYYLQSYILAEKFDSVGNLVKKIFDDNDIDHIFLKGFEIKELYPEPFQRQMGDIDLLVKPDDFDKACSILRDNSFEIDHSIDYHTSFVFNGITIELHNKLMSNDEMYNHYFKTPFNNAIKFNKNTYKLTPQFNFEYLLVHYIKHLQNGAGLRELCDLYLFLNKYEISIEHVRSILKFENNDNFVDTLLTELNYIFGYNKYPYTHNEYFIILIEYSLLSGIHGFGKNSTRAKNEYIKTKQNKVSYLLSILFISPDKLFKIYPWTRSIILLPLGYIIRFVHLLINKQNKLRDVLSTKEEDYILQKIGINN